jgi:hypothetical protein
MASRPNHLRGILMAVFSAIVVLPFILWLSTLFGPAIWVLAGVMTIAIVALIWWRRGVEAARERAYEGSSLRAVVVRMRAREAAQTLALEERRFELLGAR